MEAAEPTRAVLPQHSAGGKGRLHFLPVPPRSFLCRGGKTGSTTWRPPPFSIGFLQHGALGNTSTDIQRLWNPLGIALLPQGARGDGSCHSAFKFFGAAPLQHKAMVMRGSPSSKDSLFVLSTLFYLQRFWLIRFCSL